MKKNLVTVTPKALALLNRSPSDPRDLAFARQMSRYGAMAARGGPPAICPGEAGLLQHALQRKPSQLA
jgi:hypothetical protein